MNKSKSWALSISLLLTILALIIWTFSLQVTNLSLNGFGIISSFPIIFFVALGALIIANILLWKSAEQNKLLLWLQLIILVMMLWLTPVLISGNSNLYLANNEAYSFWTYVDYLKSYGHIQSSALYYFDWPGAWLINYATSSICNIGRDALVLVTPVLWHLVILPFMYLFLRNVFNERRQFIWAGMLLFVLISFGITRPNSEEYGFFLLLVLLSLITMPHFQQHGELPDKYICIILVLGALVITHLLSAVTGLLLLIGAVIFRNWKQKTIIILGIVMIASWLIYCATGTFARDLPKLFSQIFQIDTAFNSLALRTTIGSQEHQFAVNLKFAPIVIVLILACIGVLSLRKHLYSWVDKFIIFNIFGEIIIGFSAIGYGVITLLERLFTFGTPLFVYYAVKVLEYKKGKLVFSIIMICLVPLFFIYNYETAAGDIVTPPLLAADHYLTSNVNSNIKVITTVDRERLGYEALGTDTPYSYLAYHYIALSPLYKGYYEDFYNDPMFVERVKSVLDNNNFGIIYANSEVSIYFSPFINLK